MAQLSLNRRLILWCPYIHWYIATSVASKLLGQMGASKYEWMQSLIKDNPDNVYVYCDADITSTIHYCGNFLEPLNDIERKKELALKEAKAWNEINDLNIKPENFLNKPQQIQEGDILFTFSIYFLTRTLSALPSSSDLPSIFSRKDIFKIAQLSHYIFDFGQLVDNLNFFQFDMLLYESDLSKTSFFRKFAPTLGAVTVLPFAVQERFKATTPISERDQRCVVTGGLSKLKLADNTIEFFLHFSVDNFFPLRTLIAENAEMLSAYLNVITGNYLTQMQESSSRKSLDITAWEKYLDGPISEIKAQNFTTEYYKKDIVQIYNSHTVSYVSEEICHTPAIGFFESMACGCAPIGIDNFIYEDIGLVKDKNYITFDGSLGGLLETVLSASKKTGMLEDIVEENKAFIAKYLTSESVCMQFITKLEEQYLRWQNR